MSSPTDSIYYGGGGTTVGGGDGDTDDGSDGEGDLDLLRDKDGKSDGGGEDDDVKSDGGDDNDGISDGNEDGKSDGGGEDGDVKSDGGDDDDGIFNGSSGCQVWSDSDVSLRSLSNESSPESSGYPYKAGVRSGDVVTGLTGKVVNLIIRIGYDDQQSKYSGTWCGSRKRCETRLDRSMDFEKYLEGQSMQRPPLFESDSFIRWKNRFETYVKSKDLDLWHVITNGDFQPIENNPKTKLDEVVPFEKQSDELKKRLAKNNEAKMVIYNALPRKEYERIFMCNTAKEIWKTLLITHQGNSQVKDNKIDLLVQQYEQFVIFEDESIDNAFARFNTIITSLKALDEVERLDITTLDELIENLKVHEIIIKKDSKIVKAKGERKSLALKDKKESSDEESLTYGSEDEEYSMEVRDFKKFFKRKGRFVRQPRNDKKIFQRSRDDKNGKSDRKCFRCGDPNQLFRECPKPPKDKNQRAFVGGSWSDSGEEDDEKAKDETCLVAQASSEVTMPRGTGSDHQNTRNYIPIMSNEFNQPQQDTLKLLGKRYIHQSEQIVPGFILEFYSQLHFDYNP
ncbi:zf-CCHC domain-containing protein [Tanacetum coccineum]